MFALNEKVVYPGHGVAKISRIIEKTISGNVTLFFELKFLNKNMTILVPTTNFSAIGIRPLSSSENIDAIFKVLSEPIIEPVNEAAVSNWNKRNKDYQCKLRTGNMREICKIYRDIKYMAAKKELSFGEKNLLHQTEALLVEEISLVLGVGEEQALEHLRSVFKLVDPTLRRAAHVAQVL
jgi:CarD family transcriptional regulator